MKKNKKIDKNKKKLDNRLPSSEEIKKVQEEKDKEMDNKIRAVFDYIQSRERKTDKKLANIGKKWSSVEQQIERFGTDPDKFVLTEDMIMFLFQDLYRHTLVSSDRGEREKIRICFDILEALTKIYDLKRKEKVDKIETKIVEEK